MLEKKQQAISRLNVLKTERSSWVGHWQECDALVKPRSGRFFTTDVNKGDRRFNNIYDSTATGALNVLAAGMMSGATSPARPWFRLGIPDTEMMDSHAVKEWLSEVTKLILRVFAKSNTYNALHRTYTGLGIYGTHANLMLDDFDNVVHHYPLCVGEYSLATNYKGIVDTVYREFEKPVHEVVREFGLENCSLTLQNLYKSSNYDGYVKIIHAIEPNMGRDAQKKDSKNKRFSSCYFESGGNDKKFLRESGYDDFPALCPRWDINTGDVYGESPTMVALGDIKQLQHQQIRKAECIDYQTRPPLQVPTSLRGRQVSRFPGGITYADGNTETIRSMFDVRLDLQHLSIDIQDVRQRINDRYFVNLFLMLNNSTNTSMTATEVAERHEEKMTMLGPVLESLHTELLAPLVEGTFNRLLKAGALPPPPEELQGQELSVEFVSVLAQAQRAIGTNSTDRFVASLGSVAQFKPDVLDKFDADKWADAYADMLGVDPEFIVPSDKVALVRQQRQEQAAQAQQMQQMQQGADVASTLAGADTASQNGLTDVAKMFSGYQ